MTAEQFKNYRELKVVDGHDLESATQEGWVLLQTLTESETRIEQEQSPRYIERTPDGYGGYSENMMASKSHVIQVTKYLLGKDESDVIAALREQIATLRGDVYQAEKKAEHLAKDKEAETRTLADNRARLGDVEGELETCRSELSRSRASQRRIEADLSKIRGAIGSQKFKEILNAPVSDGQGDY